MKQLDATFKELQNLKPGQKVWECAHLFSGRFVRLYTFHSYDPSSKIEDGVAVRWQGGGMQYIRNGVRNNGVLPSRWFLSEESLNEYMNITVRSNEVQRKVKQMADAYARVRQAEEELNQLSDPNYIFWETKDFTDESFDWEQHDQSISDMNDEMEITDETLSDYEEQQIIDKQE